MQAAMPCLLFAPGACEVVLRGGTNADMAPQIDYTLMVRSYSISNNGNKLQQMLLAIVVTYPHCVGVQAHSRKIWLAI